MKVSELIEELNKMPKHHTVRVTIEDDESTIVAQSSDFVMCWYKMGGVATLVFRGNSND